MFCWVGFCLDGLCLVCYDWLVLFVFLLFVCVLLAVGCFFEGFCVRCCFDAWFVCFVGLLLWVWCGLLS